LVKDIGDTKVSRRPNRERSQAIERAKRNQRVTDNIDAGKPSGDGPPPVDDGLCKLTSPDNETTCQLPAGHVGCHEKDLGKWPWHVSWYGTAWFDASHTQRPISARTAQRLARTANAFTTVVVSG
jgi:hypothetical protein